MQLDVFFMLSFPGAMRKTGGLIVFGPSYTYLLVVQYRMGRDFEGENGQHNVDFIVETVRVTEECF